MDFLFVIDNSNSMATNQGELIRSFPQLAEKIQATLGQVDSFHVGVVTSDAYEWNEPRCAEMGALVTQTGGKDSSDRDCGPFSGGQRYLTEADALGERFACMAQVGTAGAWDEAVAAAALAALGPDMTGAGACNDGFVRTDALLVLVLVSDEDDPGTCVTDSRGSALDCDGSPGDPRSWADSIRSIKGGDGRAVLLSLVRGAPGNTCRFATGTEKDGRRLMELTGQFGEFGVVGDICADDYGPFFDRAVRLIDTACRSYEPPR